MNTRAVTTEIAVVGMTCTHCSNAISEALTVLSGVAVTEAGYSLR